MAAFLLKIAYLMMQMNGCGAKCVVYSDTYMKCPNKSELKQIKPCDSHNIKKEYTSQCTGPKWSISSVQSVGLHHSITDIITEWSHRRSKSKP